jgi:hypothetical protein
MSLVASWLEQANTGMVGHELPAPVSTIVGGGLRLGPRSADRGAAGAGRRRHRPARQGAGVPLVALRRADAEEWADPAATLQARLKFGLVI